MEHFTAGLPILGEGGSEAGDTNHAVYKGEEGEVVDQIKELLDTRVRPAVAQDGGDITFRYYEEGVVYLDMRGSCAGCPSATLTLQAGIENLLKHYIPEVTRVEPA